jgi:hypothetical protein
LTNNGHLSSEKQTNKIYPQLIANPKSISLVFDTVLLLDLLANFRRFESRNPYLVRMEDYVDEKAMERIISLSTLALEDLRE